MPNRGRAALGRASVSLLLSVGAACAPTLFVPPVGPGEPAPDAATAWASASADCRRAPSLVATLRVSGKIGRDNLPTTITIVTGVTSQGLRLEGQAAGRNVFRLAGDLAEATLYLDDGHRYARGTPEALSDALVGVAFGPARWLALLTGCAISSADVASGARYPTSLAVTMASGRAYLETVNGSWQIVAGVFDQLVVTYARMTPGPPRLPAEWFLRSEPGREPAVDLRIRVEDPSVDRPVGPDAFHFPLPNDAVSMTLDELRQSGPLRAKGR